MWKLNHVTTRFSLFQVCKSSRNNTFTNPKKRMQRIFHLDNMNIQYKQKGKIIVFHIVIWIFELSDFIDLGIWDLPVTLFLSINQPTCGILVYFQLSHWDNDRKICTMFHSYFSFQLSCGNSMQNIDERDE